MHKDLFEVASEGLLLDVNSVAPPAVFDFFIRFLGTAPARIPNVEFLLREATAFLRLFLCRFFHGLCAIGAGSSSR